MSANLDRTKRSDFLLEAPRHGAMFARDLGRSLIDLVVQLRNRLLYVFAH